VTDLVEIKVDNRIGRACNIRSCRVPEHHKHYCDSYAGRLRSDLVDGNLVFKSTMYFGNNAGQMVNCLSWSVVQVLLQYNKNLTTGEANEEVKNFFIVDPDVLRDLTNFNLTDHQKALKEGLNTNTFYMLFRTPEFAFTTKIARSLFAEILSKRTAQGLPTAIVSNATIGTFYTSLMDHGKTVKDILESEDWDHLKNFS